VSEPFLISDERLRALSATRQGRVSIAGYNYQAAYGVARLVSMSVRQPLLNLEDWPQRLRYDWGKTSTKSVTTARLDSRSVNKSSPSANLRLSLTCSSDLRRSGCGCTRQSAAGCAFVWSALIPGSRPAAARKIH
jgi:hypothetical protein